VRLIAWAQNNIADREESLGGRRKACATTLWFGDFSQLAEMRRMFLMLKLDAGGNESLCELLSNAPVTNVAQVLPVLSHYRDRCVLGFELRS
jgi:hypothetical protein